MKAIFTTAILLGLFGMASVGQAADNAMPTTTPSTQPVAAVPFNAYCPVDTEKPIDPTVTYLYDGKLYGFCCEDCLKDFKKDPEKYAGLAK